MGKVAKTLKFVGEALNCVHSLFCGYLYTPPSPLTIFVDKKEYSLWDYSARIHGSSTEIIVQITSEQSKMPIFTFHF